MPVKRKCNRGPSDVEVLVNGRWFPVERLEVAYGWLVWQTSAFMGHASAAYWRWIR
jgi:hypothetical protein